LTAFETQSASGLPANAPVIVTLDTLPSGEMTSYIIAMP
jgi:hypothetical protein